MFNFYFIFNFLEPSFFSGQWLTSFPGCTPLSRNMAAMAADEDRFDVEIDLPRFLNSVLEKAEYISQRNVEGRIVEQHIVVVDQTVSLLHSLMDAEKEILSDLSSAFNDVFCAMQQCFANLLLSPTSAAQNFCPKRTSPVVCWAR